MSDGYLPPVETSTLRFLLALQVAWIVPIASAAAEESTRVPVSESEACRSSESSSQYFFLISVREDPEVPVHVHKTKLIPPANWAVSRSRQGQVESLPDLKRIQSGVIAISTAFRAPPRR